MFENRFYSITLFRALVFSVLFAADIRVKFDEYSKSMIGQTIAKTVITVNPGMSIIVKIF